MIPSVVTIEEKELGRTREKIPVIGLGTYGIGGHMGRATTLDDEQVTALEYALRKGMRFFDTAEMYSGGHSEELLGRAIKNSGLKREDLFITTKVSPDHLRFEDVLKAADSSLRRLGLGYIDLYLVHWPNHRIPIVETMRAMEKLVDEGKTRYVGVSNFSNKETQEATKALSKYDIVANQLEYSILAREIETEQLPFCEKEGITVIAYTPLARGRVSRYEDKLSPFCTKYGKTPVQISLNWLTWRSKSTVAIPKSSTPKHIDEIVDTAGWKVSPNDISKIDRAFS